MKRGQEPSPRNARGGERLAVCTIEVRLELLHLVFAASPGFDRIARASFILAVDGK
jgi:hypothetical protein